MENKQQRFDYLIEQLNQIINSVDLNDEEFYRFRRYIDVLSDNVFNDKEKYYYSIVIEDEINNYRDVVSIYGTNPKPPGK